MFKKKFLLLIFTSGFALGFVGHVFAWFGGGPVAGVDYPYDSAAYYSDTAVSYADSPSTFALRDLAAKGGSVYDKRRDTESIKFATDFQSWVDVIKTRNIWKLLNIKSLDTSALNGFKSAVSSLQNKVNSTNENNPYKEMLNSKKFRDFNDQTPVEESRFNEKEQIKLLEEKYLAFADEAQKAMHENAESDAALKTILEQIKTAEGKLQMDQLLAQLESLNNVEQSRKAALIAKLIELKAVRQKAETDQYLKAVRIAEANKLHIADPYKERDDIKRVYTRPKGVGFKSFE